MKQKLDVNDILDIDWLRNENVQLRIEDMAVPLRTFFISKFINRQLPDYSRADVVKTLESVIYNIQRRTIYTWLQKSFDPNKAYPKHYKTYKSRLPESGKEEFTVQVLSKHKEPKELASIKICLDAMEDAAFKPIVRKNDIDIVSVLQKKENFIQEAPVVFDSVDSMEELVVRLCEDFATGLITITEACERHGLTYLQFVEVITKSSHCQMIYEKASRYANMLQNSRQLTLVDNMIIQLLTTGQHVTVETKFEKYIVPGKLEPVWKEKYKTKKVRQLTPNELITLKMLLVKSVAFGTMEESSEFASMSEEELMDYIVKNNDELQRGLSANPTINK